MFGRKKMYKRGMEDAMRAYEKFGKKQEAALEKIREEVRSGNKKLEEMISALGEDINNVYEFLTDKEKAALYSLCTPKDIKELGDAEKRLLVAILYQLAENEGAWGLTDYQKKYVRSVQNYLGITNPQVDGDLSKVENIDSLEDQKAFLQTVLEFFYLQDANEISEDQEEFLGYFCLNKKQAEQIELYVSKLYNTVGPEGLCEKYGFVPEDTLDEVIDKSSCEGNTLDSEFYYDFRINALRKWSDDSVIAEPGENCRYWEVSWYNNFVVWKGKEYHILDAVTLDEVAKFKTELDIEYVSDDICVTRESGALLIYNFEGVLRERKTFNCDGISIVGVYENDVIVTCSTDDYYWLIRYNCLTGSEEEIDRFDRQIRTNNLSRYFLVNNLLLLFVEPPRAYGCEHKSLFDIWCYDLEQNKYIWKQFQVLRNNGICPDLAGDQSNDYTHRKSWVEYGEKIEFCCESKPYEYRRIILEKSTGNIIYDKEIMLGYKPFCKFIKRIDHSVLYVFREDSIKYAIFDISEYLGLPKAAKQSEYYSEDTIFVEVSDTYDDVSDNVSDQVNEIIRKWKFEEYHV